MRELLDSLAGSVRDECMSQIRQVVAGLRAERRHEATKRFTFDDGPDEVRVIVTVWRVPRKGA